MEQNFNLLKSICLYVSNVQVYLHRAAHSLLLSWPNHIT